MIVLLLILLICVLLWQLLQFRLIESKIRHIPGPSVLPIIGNGLLFIGKSPETILETTRKIHKEYGNFFRVFVGMELDIVLADPKDVEFVLSSHDLIEKADEYNPIAEWLGTGLLISTGRKWFSRRKVITPAFHFKILEQFVSVFEKHSEIFVKNLKNFEGQNVDIFPFVSLLTLDVICETSMGVEIHAQTKSSSEYVKAVKEIANIITIRHYNFLLRSNWIFKLTPLYQRQRKILRTLHGFTDSVISSRREELIKVKSDIFEECEDDFGTKRKSALLDILLMSSIDGKPLTNMDIREEVDTFMFEGHDTTTSALSFCLYNLAKYPEIQKRVFDEIRNVIGDDMEYKITLADLNRLTSLELVIRETLRMFPSVPFYGRKIQKDFYLNGKFIPKGSSVGLAPLFMGYDPKIFKDPETFNPERFVDEATIAEKNPFAYIPFSAGSRNCIGQKFAMLEIKSSLSKLLRNFELKVGKNFEPILAAELILRPTNGIVLQLQKRNYV